MTIAALVRRRWRGQQAGLEDAWRRNFVLLGVAVLAVIAAGVLTDLGRTFVPAVVAAVLAVGAAAWLLELFAPSTSDAVTAGLLVLVGACGAVLNGLAPHTPGFVLAYLAVSAAGLRLRLPVGVGVTAVVVVGLDIGIAATSGHLAASLLSTDAGAGFVFVVALAAQSARVARRRTEELLVELERSRAAQAEAAALAERTRLAREMHDILAHSLSGLALSLDGLRLLAQQDDAGKGLVDGLHRAGRLARGGLADSRRAIAALRGEPLPGPELIPDLVENAATMGIEASFETTGTPQALLPEAGLCAYRSVQEALTNTAKYAGPGSRAEISLAWGADSVEVRARDHAGPHGAVEAGGSQFGLSGLRERAELSGGSLWAGPTDDGFEVRLCLPYVDVPQRRDLRARRDAKPRADA